jgi:flavin reductase (DIM6/NTAB) family NADH-FMN oxidoreductase RutF
MVHAAYSQLDISQFDEADRYKFMMGTVIPRPIALVTSLSRDGVLNAAPFSQFVVISVTPPLLGFVAHEGEHGLKDTVRNVIECGEYVVNTVAEPMAKRVQICSENFPPSVSEVAEVGFHNLPSNFVRPGRIAESSVHFECRLVSAPIPAAPPVTIARFSCKSWPLTASRAVGKWVPDCIGTPLLFQRTSCRHARVREGNFQDDYPVAFSGAFDGRIDRRRTQLARGRILQAKRHVPHGIVAHP